MELTVEQIRAIRKDNDGFKGLCYVAYNVTTGKVDKIFTNGNEAWKYADGKPHIYAVNISNSIHTPRHIYLELTPYSQTNLFLDGYIDDGTLVKHEALRKQVLKREGKITID